MVTIFQLITNVISITSKKLVKQLSNKTSSNVSMRLACYQGLAKQAKSATSFKLAISLSLLVKLAVGLFYQNYVQVKIL